MAAGKFITFEGGEGAGKTTQAEILRAKLSGCGYPTLLTREPGGTPRAEEIRKALISGRARRFGPFAEAVLFYAARDSHLNLTIRPALSRGVWVICDRFSDSTRAYQGAAAGVPAAALAALDRLVVHRTQPDLTIILDLPPEKGLARATARRAAAGESADRFEAAPLAFHRSLRDEFRRIAAAEPARCVLIDANRPAREVEEEIWKAVRERLNP